MDEKTQRDVDEAMDNRELRNRKPGDPIPAGNHPAGGGAKVVTEFLVNDGDERVIQFAGQSWKIPTGRHAVKDLFTVPLPAGVSASNIAHHAWATLSGCRVEVEKVEAEAETEDVVEEEDVKDEETGVVTKRKVTKKRPKRK